MENYVETYVDWNWGHSVNEFSARGRYNYLTYLDYLLPDEKQELIELRNIISEFDQKKREEQERFQRFRELEKQKLLEEEQLRKQKKEDLDLLFKQNENMESILGEDIETHMNDLVSQCREKSQMQLYLLIQKLNKYIELIKKNKIGLMDDEEIRMYSIDSINLNTANHIYEKKGRKRLLDFFLEIIKKIETFKETSHEQWKEQRLDKKNEWAKQKKFCEFCECDVPKRHWAKHIASQKHISKI